MIDITLLTLKQMYRSRKTYVLEIFLFLPLVLGIYSVHKNENGIVVFSDMTYGLYLQLLVILVTLIFATTLISDDIKTGRITFLTTRVSRVRIIVEKYLGYLIGTFVIFLVPLTAMAVVLTVYAPENVPLTVFCSYTLIILMAIAAYGGVYFLVSTLISKPLMFGLFFAFIWEISAPAVSQRLAKATVGHYIRSVGYELVEHGNIHTMSTPSSFTQSVGILCALSVVGMLLSAMLFKQKSLE